MARCGISALRVWALLPGGEEPRPWIHISHERGVALPAGHARPARRPGRPPAHTRPSAVGLRARRHDGVTNRRRPLHPCQRVRRPIRSLLLQSLFRRSLEGRRTRRGARNLCRTFPAPPHSEPSVPNLPGHHRPRPPQPSGSAGGRLRAPLNGASGAGGLRCWRDLPNDNPRSSALLALRSGPLVKAAHPSAQKNSSGTTIFLAPERVLAGGGRRSCRAVAPVRAVVAGLRRQRP
jgi:hypothetical protein